MHTNLSFDSEKSEKSGISIMFKYEHPPSLPSPLPTHLNSTLSNNLNVTSQFYPILNNFFRSPRLIFQNEINLHIASCCEPTMK